MLSKTLLVVDGRPVGIHPLIKNLLSGCYNLNPPKPKYSYSWDPSTVISYLSSLGDNLSLPLATLTRKATVLLALASLLRVSELVSISLPSISFLNGEMKFTLLAPRKAQHAGPLQSIMIPGLPEENCCPVKAVKAYIDCTSQFRNDTNRNVLFVSLISPHGKVTANTMSGWIRTCLGMCGVDTSVFKAHSTRGAAASKAAKLGISVDAILKAGHWSTESTFSKFYKRSTTPSIVAAVFQPNFQV